MQLKMWFEKSKEWEIKEDLIFYLLWLLIDKIVNCVRAQMGRKVYLINI